MNCCSPVATRADWVEADAEAVPEVVVADGTAVVARTLAPVVGVVVGVGWESWPRSRLAATATASSTPPAIMTRRTGTRVEAAGRGEPRSV